MRSILTDTELAEQFRALARDEGETIWTREIVVGERRYSLPFMWTTWLASFLERGSLIEHDPKKWIVDSLKENEFRLYLRIGEHYGEGWIHHFVPPVKVAIKSEDEFISVSELAREHWWQAEFVCPFCGSLCFGSTNCPHLLIVQNSVIERHRTKVLVSLLDEMSNRMFNCNMLNANIEGLKIKVPRVFINAEWFRFAYWYVHDPNLIAKVEQVWLEGNRRNLSQTR